MPLWIHESIHLALSLLAAYIAVQFYRSNAKKRKTDMIPAVLVIAGIMAGFFVDLDHLFDYFMAYGLTFDLHTFLSGTQFLVHNKNYVPLHGFEYVIILLTIFFRIKPVKTRAVILAVALGLLGHLCFDVYVNEMKPLAYSVIYRAAHGFDIIPDLTPVHLQRHLLERDQFLNHNRLPEPR